MGNQQSQDTVPSSITSHLSHRTKAKLSEQKPGIKHLFLPPISKKTIGDEPCLTPTTLHSSHSSMSSSSTSSMKYTASNGRKYMTTNYSRCLLPCDEEESDRLIIQHFLLKYAFGANFISPVHSLLQHSMDDRPQVLEIGTGPGTWVLEMATEYSETDFHGIDLAAMYPTTIKPSNAHFQQHDILEGGALPFEDGTFEFIYMRQTLSAFSQTQLIQIFSEITRVLKPNGYLEIVDVEYQIQRAVPGSVSSLVNHYLQENVSSTQGPDFDLCAQLSTFPHHGGLTDTMQERVTMPLGWGDQLGDLLARNLDLFLKSLHPNLLQQQNDPKRYPTMDEINNDDIGFVLTDDVIQDTLEECKHNKSHLTWCTFTARKPASMSWQNEKKTATNYGDSLLSSPPTPPLDPLEWESINSFVTGYVE
ncbi:unnamed protein product [Absidia cylindrospora]